MNGEERSSDHLVLGGLLFLVFSLVVALVFVYTRAGDVSGSGSSGVGTTTVQVANVGPVMEQINIAYSSSTAHIASSTGIDLAVGTTKPASVWGIVSDVNGEDDINTVTMALYRSGLAAGTGCTADNNDCYKDAACDIDKTYGDATQAKFFCDIALEFYTDSTVTSGQYPTETWIGSASVADITGTIATLTNETDVNALLALTLPTDIPYGSLGLGATTTADNNIPVLVTQKGNVIANVNVKGTDMACNELGIIPLANQKWSLSDVGYSDATSTLTTATLGGEDTDIAVGYHGAGTANSSLDATPVTKNIYWNIKIPTTGVKGTCTGANTLTILGQL